MVNKNRFISINRNRSNMVILNKAIIVIKVWSIINMTNFNNLNSNNSLPSLKFL